MHNRFRVPILALVTLAFVFTVAVGQGQSQSTQPSRRERRKGANPDDQKREINVDGTKRQYLLYVPAAAAKGNPMPLLLVFHGGGGHDYNMPRFTGFDDIADAHGFIVAYPDSVNRHWNDARELSTADDVGFIRALISDVERTYSVDAARIYATGISNGGFFSQRLACDLADRIAAVASVAATMPEPLVPICKPSRPVSVMFLQGTDDPLVHINGGAVAKTHGRNISLADSVRFWTDHDATRKKPESSDLPHHDPNGTSVHRDVYSGGKQGTEVIVYTIQGGGHTWPGGEQYLPAFLVGKVNHDIDASHVIWEFFSRHSR
ncbi:MAG TPA: PHB depolymerase family esterase [Terriglobales bacterium]|nr:PHB depolymerase family esterase [Terriglobales bacterium]